MKTCRVCLGEEGDMISPCNCSGTIGYIHEECLSTWILHDLSDECNVCKQKYNPIYSKCAECLLLRGPIIRVPRDIAPPDHGVMIIDCLAVMVSIMLLVWMGVRRYYNYTPIKDTNDLKFLELALVIMIITVWAAVRGTYNIESMELAFNVVVCVMVSFCVLMAIPVTVDGIMWSCGGYLKFMQMLTCCLTNVCVE